jgi:signal transduction histidine kinase
MADHLAQELADLRHGDHVCLPYETDGERDQATVRFIADGITRGERCIYVLEADQHDAWLRTLTRSGIDAGRAIQRGALWLRTPPEVYLREGGFDPDDTLAFLQSLIDRALADGFTGLRASGERSSPAGGEIPWPSVLSYEARINEWFARRPFVALCRYRRADFAPEILHDVLRTHPVAMVGDHLCRNPFYEQADVALSPDAEGARVEWMLRQLRWSRLTERRLRQMIRSLAEQTARLAAEQQLRARAGQELARAVRTRDRLLDLVTRELSASVGGLTPAVQAPAPGSPRGAPAQCGGAGDGIGDEGGLRRHVQRLCALTEELRQVSRLTNRQTPPALDPLDLVDVARQVASRQRARLAGAGCTISVRAGARVEGRWERWRLEALIDSLVTTAAARAGDQPVDLEVTAEGDLALLCVRYRGAAPADDEELPSLDHRAPRRSPDRAAGPAGGSSEAAVWVSREIAGAMGAWMQIDVTAGPPLETTLSIELPRSGRRRAP